MLEVIRLLERTEELLTNFDEGLWNATGEKATVQLDGGMVFPWKIDTEVSIAE